MSGGTWFDDDDDEHNPHIWKEKRNEQSPSRGPVLWMSTHLQLHAILVCKIELGPWGLAARAEVFHEPEPAAGAEQVGVIGWRAIGYRFCGAFVEVGEFVGEGLYLGAV